MSNRRVVYEGQSYIGRVKIFDGDTIHYTSGLIIKEGTAFYSVEYTRPDYITFRITGYNYETDMYGSPDNCHSIEYSRLVKVTPSKYHTKIKTGFGSFIERIERNT